MKKSFIAALLLLFIVGGVTQAGDVLTPGASGPTVRNGDVLTPGASGPDNRNGDVLTPGSTGGNWTWITKAFLQWLEFLKF